MQDKISVIVPIYNVEKYLHKCVDSILAQTYENIEVILVNDGSPDNCGAICDEYATKDSRIRVIHKTNGGLSSARNAGVDIAEGKYIGFIDSDDYISPYMYEKLYDAITDANADLAICGHVPVDTNGVLCGNPEEIPENIVYKRRQAMDELYSRRYGVYVSACKKLYKSNLFNIVRFPEGKIHEDEFTTHRFFHECEKIVVIKDVLYFYVQSEGSIMRSEITSKRLDANDAYWQSYKFLKSNGYKKSASNAFRWGLRYSIDFVFNMKGGGRAKAFFHLIRQLFTLLITPRLWQDVALPILSVLIKKLVVFVPKLISKKIFPIRMKSKISNARKNGKPVIFLLGTPTHGNLGDHAIVYAEKLLLEKLGYTANLIEFSNDDYRHNRDWLKHKVINTNDIILVDGGGNMGTLWVEADMKIADIISRFSENKIFIFTQTCYYDESEPAQKLLEKNISIYCSAKDLIICLRDKASYDFAKENFIGVKLIFTPDIVLSITGAPKHSNKKGVLLCFREDKEKVTDFNILTTVKNYLKNKKIKETDTVINKRVTQKNRYRELNKKWREFAHSELVITDRLHAMIFAAITNTPCIAVDNKSKKVSGSYEFIKELPYICIAQNTDEILDKIPEMINADISKSYNYPDAIEKEIASWHK